MRLFTRLQKLSSDFDKNEWRLLSLESSYVRDRIVAAFPGVEDDAGGGRRRVMSDEAKAYPRSYRCLALVMLKRGLKPRRDLPHEDDSESIERIVNRNRAFLHGGEA